MQEKRVEKAKLDKKEQVEKEKMRRVKGKELEAIKAKYASLSLVRQSMRHSRYVSRLLDTGGFGSGQILFLVQICN